MSENLDLLTDYCVKVVSEARNNLELSAKVLESVRSIETLQIDEDHTVKTMLEEISIKEAEDKKYLAEIDKRFELLEEKEKKLEAEVAELERTYNEEREKLNYAKKHGPNEDIIRAYKNLFRTTFDFTNKNSVTGYMAKEDGTYSTFHFDKDKLSQKMITEKLWEQLVKLYSDGGSEEKQ